MQNNQAFNGKIAYLYCGVFIAYLISIEPTALIGGYGWLVNGLKSVVTGFNQGYAFHGSKFYFVLQVHHC